MHKDLDRELPAVRPLDNPAPQWTSRAESRLRLERGRTPGANIHSSMSTLCDDMPPDRVRICPLLPAQHYSSASDMLIEST